MTNEGMYILYFIQKLLKGVAGGYHRLVCDFMLLSTKSVVVIHV